MDKANQGSKPSTSNLADGEYDAANAGKVWGFKIISRFDKLSDTTKSTVVSHNMNILKDLPSEIKTSIIKKCLKNKSEDYVGLEYLDFYVRGKKNHVVEQEPKKDICKKRSKSDESTDSKEDEENRAPPKKKREKEKAVLEVSPEEIKGKITEQENHSRGYFFKNRRHVKYADSEEDDQGEKKRTPQKKKKEKKKARARTIIPMPMPPESLPEEIKGKIVELNGTDIKWVITKRLFSSDVVQNLNRFSMPLNQIDIGFLTDEERKRLDAGGGIEVGMVGPTGELSRLLVLKRWNMEKPSGNVIVTYNLITGWYKDIVEANGLEIGHLVHVWSFREGNNLSFALVKVDE